jgi:citrate lyase subunit beta/citryl-CoA lyase
MVVASRLANLPGPIDAVFTAAEDLDGLAMDARLGRSLGFMGKACVRASQVATVNQVFASQ